MQNKLVLTSSKRGEIKRGGPTMNQYLMEFMKKNTSFSEEVLEEIMQDMLIETYKKGTILLRQGDISNKCYFVLKGCIRQYSFGEDGKEITNNFFTEEQAVVMFKSYKQRVTSDYSLACVEESILLVGDFQTEENMYQKFPELDKITRSMIELSFGETQDASAAFMSSTPEERYSNIVKQRPGLIERVPQHQLSSYLGITPESLSRIKKRVSKEGV